MTVNYFFILLVSSIFQTSVQSTELQDTDSNRDLNSDTGIIEELVRRLNENDARIKLLEERNDRMLEQLFTQDQEIIRLQKLISVSESFKDYVNEETSDDNLLSEKSVREVQRNKKNGDQEKTSRAVIDAHVAFTAVLSTDTHHLGLNQNVAFDSALVNDGNAYNPNDGLFVAPYTGTYVFSTTVMVDRRNNTHFEFAKNGKVLTIMYLNGAEKFYNSSAQTIVLHLQTGDDVSVKHTESDKSMRGQNHSLFSGFLLYRSYSDESIVG